MAINFSMMGFADRLALRDDYIAMDEKQSATPQTTPITVTPEDKPKQEFERLSEAKRQYPYLQDKDFDYVENLTDDKKAGYLEFWEPGDEGPPDGSVKRPEGIGIDRMGIEVRNPDTRPIDILGDYVSHEAIYSDPKLKDIYDRYTSTLTDKQLKVKYEYEKKNYGEDRPFEQWAERSGKPGMFRGYTFDQFSEDEIKDAYTEEQLKILDEARDYLGIKKLNSKGKDVEAGASDDVYKNYILSWEGDFFPEAKKATEDEKELTIGYGHYGEDVKPGQTITREEADVLLDKDIQKRIPAIMKAIPKFNNLSENLRKNIVSSWYRGSLSGSPKTIELINQSKFKEAAKEFLDNDEYRNAEKRNRSGIKSRMKATSKALADE